MSKPPAPGQIENPDDISDIPADFLHAPSPWIGHAQGDANHYRVLDANDQWLFAIQQNGEMTLARQEANMLVIENAPDLLAALVQAAAALATCANHAPEEQRAVIKEWFANACAAIVKATSAAAH